MACSKVVYGMEGLQIWKVAISILNSKYEVALQLRGLVDS
jgi:hypothetical protein